MVALSEPLGVLESSEILGTAETQGPKKLED